MKRHLPPLSELERITSKELGEHFDEVLERVSAEDIALIIEHEGKSYVLCPAHWMDMPEVEHFETMLKNAVRYAVFIDEADLKETVEMVITFGYALSSECIQELLNIIKDKPGNDLWLAMKKSLEERLPKEKEKS